MQQLRGPLLQKRRAGRAAREIAETLCNLEPRGKPNLEGGGLVNGAHGFYLQRMS